MKKMITLGLIIVLIMSLIQWCNFNEKRVYGSETVEVDANDISDKLIRFHVLANSDSESDQKLKLKVRDEVLKYISPKLKDSNSIDESRKILLDNDGKIKQIAEQVIRNNGYKYKVVTMLSRENFPVKNYGNITLPQGNYEAYRILIGDAKGQNWWCVMFPPLCFVDITKGQLAYKETEDEMKKVLSDEQVKGLTQSSKKDEKEKDKTKIIFKFKIKELIDELIKKM